MVKNGVGPKSIGTRYPSRPVPRSGTLSAVRRASFITPFVFFAYLPIIRHPPIFGDAVAIRFRFPLINVCVIPLLLRQKCPQNVPVGNRPPLGRAKPPSVCRRRIGPLFLTPRRITSRYREAGTPRPDAPRPWKKPTSSRWKLASQDDAERQKGIKVLKSPSRATPASPMSP